MKAPRGAPGLDVTSLAMGDEAKGPAIGALRDRLKAIDWGHAYLRLARFAISWRRTPRAETHDAIRVACARLWAVRARRNDKESPIDVWGDGDLTCVTKEERAA